MTRTVVVTSINAPPGLVFRTISEIENFTKAVPDIVGVEFLTATKHGAGTRFRETRLMGKRKATVEMEVTEHVENDHVRIVSDTGGTIWDTIFSVTPANGGTELKLVMDAKTNKFIPKVMNFLMKGMIRKAIVSDMHAVKAYCEAQGA